MMSQELVSKSTLLEQDQSAESVTGLQFTGLELLHQAESSLTRNLSQVVCQESLHSELARYSSAGNSQSPNSPKEPRLLSTAQATTLTEVPTLKLLLVVSQFHSTVISPSILRSLSATILRKDLLPSQFSIFPPCNPKDACIFSSKKHHLVTLSWLPMIKNGVQDGQEDTCTFPQKLRVIRPKNGTWLQKATSTVGKLALNTVSLMTRVGPWSARPEEKISAHTSPSKKEPGTTMEWQVFFLPTFQGKTTM